MDQYFNKNPFQSYSDSRLKIKYYLGGLIWPFGVMLAAFSHRDRKWSMNLLWLFCLFLGLTFVIAEKGPDSSRYAEILRDFHSGDLAWTDLVNSFYDPAGNYVDVVQPIVTWCVSLITDDASFLFATFGLIFGYFYSRNIWFLLEKIEKRISPFKLIFILSLILINPIWNINGFRMNCAFQVFIYGLLPFLTEGDRKKIWWSVFSVLFHFSFILPVLLIGLYLIFKNRLNIFFILFIITSFIRTINLDSVKGFLSFLPDFLIPRIDSYLDPYYVEQSAKATEALNWFVPLAGEVLTYIVYAFAILIFIKERNNLAGPFLNLFCFGTWFYSWANIASLLPSGGRFLALANYIMIFFIIVYLEEHSHKRLFRVLKISAIPGLLLFMIVQIRIGLQYMSLSTLLGNPILSLFINDQTPLVAYIKDLF